MLPWMRAVSFTSLLVCFKILYTLGWVLYVSCSKFVKNLSQESLCLLLTSLLASAVFLLYSSLSSSFFESSHFYMTFSLLLIHMSIKYVAATCFGTSVPFVGPQYIRFKTKFHLVGTINWIHWCPHFVYRHSICANVAYKCDGTWSLRCSIITTQYTARLQLSVSVDPSPTHTHVPKKSSETNGALWIVTSAQE